MRALVFFASPLRCLVATAALSRVFAFAGLLALGAAPAHGVNGAGLRLPEPSDGLEREAPAKPSDLSVRATQINRCPDGQGGVRLQDRPCTPVETPVAAAIAATASAAEGRGDVIDLSALPPRSAPAEGSTATTAAEREKPGMLRGMRDGALKLVAFVVSLYVVWRLARGLRAWLRQRPPKADPPPDSRSFGRPAPRPRAVIRRPERRRGSRWRRSS